MSATRVTSVQAAGQSTFTSSGVDTTGATALFVAVTAASPATLTDSYGNTWAALSTTAGSGIATYSRIFYCLAPVVGAGHTFTLTGFNQYAVLNAMAFSGGTFSYDAENGTDTSGGTTQATGSATPSGSSGLMIVVTSFAQSSSVSINSSFTVDHQRPLSGGVNYGHGSGYKVKSDALAENPTWTYTNSDDKAVRIAAFTLTGGGGGGGATINDHNYRGSNRGMGLGMGRGMSYHAHPEISLEAYRREQARKHREFMAKVSRRAA